MATGLGLTLLMALFLIYPPVLSQQADLRLYDLMLSGRTSPPKSDIPLLVGIDEESLKAYGQWPWPRYRLARLVERLHQQGAKVVALDFLMPEPDRTSPELINAENRRDLEISPPLSPTRSTDSNSQQLAEAMAKGQTVLGFFFDFTGMGDPAAQVSPVIPGGMVVVTSKPGSYDAWPHPRGMIRGIPLLTGAVYAEGFTNALNDRDGAIRRVPLLLLHDGKHYPSLALAALLGASPDRNLHLGQDTGETELVLGNRRIPLDRQGNLLLDFRDEHDSFTYLSARSVLAGEHPPRALQGKIVLVGPWAKGLGDHHLVPSGHSVSGLAIHATVIDNILAGTFISRPGWARGAELCALLGLGLLSSWLLSRAGFVMSVLAVSAGSAGCYWAGRELLVARGLYISPLLPMLTPVVIMTFLSLLKYGIEARKVRKRTNDLIEAQDTIIRSMSTLTAIRDKETGGHILRTQRYVALLAGQISSLPEYRYLDENSIDLLTKSAPLHDIGKVGLPDSILRKPGKLTEEEYTLMKNHTLIGAHALSRSIGDPAHPGQLEFLQFARQMIESHHERWDGSGYPHGLRGKDIPLAGRLMALADVYDALVSQRTYKQQFSHENALDIIRRDSGSMFDPDVVAAFVAKNDEFSRIAQEFSDDADLSGDEVMTLQTYDGIPSSPPLRS